MKLTPREVQITVLAVNGFRHEDIGTLLSISPTTVKNHLTAIFEKLGVTRIAAAWVRGVQLGVFDPSQALSLDEQEAQGWFDPWGGKENYLNMRREVSMRAVRRK